MDRQMITLGNEERTVCEVWTRVMGYYRPTSAFNKGKKSEYNERQCFEEDRIADHEKDKSCESRAA